MVVIKDIKIVYIVLLIFKRIGLNEIIDKPTLRPRPSLKLRLIPRPRPRPRQKNPNNPKKLKTQKSQQKYPNN